VARQAQGLDLASVADQLHLRAAVIESLEHDDYEALPGEVFVVGYIRKYARLVGLDPEPLLASYQTGAPQAEQMLSGIVPRRDRQIGSGHFVVRLVSVLLLTVLVGLTFLWWKVREPRIEVERMDPGEERETRATAVPESIPGPQAAAPTGTSPVAVPAGSPSPPAVLLEQTANRDSAPAAAGAEGQPTVDSESPSEEDTRDEGAASTLTAPADAGSAAVQVTEGSATAKEEVEETAAAAAPEILMSFDGPCWVDVRDSERQYKLFGEMKKGDRQTLEGKPPYSVILGNAAAVQITIDGKAFDLDTVTRGNVARFTLDPSKPP
jgi:cytoskeleton protein RodZ